MKNGNSSPSLRFEGCVVTNIEQAYRNLERVYERMVSPLGLNVLEWYALRALYHHDGLSASQLAAQVCRHPSSMTALLDRMEQKGLVRRRVAPEDRRSVQIFLTEQGQALREGVLAVAERLEHLLDDKVAPDEMRVFLHVLSVLQQLDAGAG